MCGSEKELRASQAVFKELTKAGANIKELNTVRSIYLKLRAVV